jgi:hypothetical protein
VSTFAASSFLTVRQALRCYKLQRCTKFGSLLTHKLQMHLATDAEHEQRCEGHRRTDERTATRLGSAKSLRPLLSTSVRLPAVQLVKPLSDPGVQHQAANTHLHIGREKSGCDGWQTQLLHRLRTSVRSQARSQGCILAVCRTSSATCKEYHTLSICRLVHTPSRSCDVSRWPSSPSCPRLLRLIGP